MEKNIEELRKTVRTLVLEKDELHPNDPSIQQYWGKLSEILTLDVDTTIEVLDGCTQDEIESIADVFEDISEGVRSIKFVRYLERLQERYPGYYLGAEIQYAKEMAESI